MNDLQASLAADEDLTVIAADTFIEKNKSFKENEKNQETAELRDSQSSGHPLGQEIRSVNNHDCVPLKPRPMERPITPPCDTSIISRGFFCAGAGDVFDMMPSSSGNTNRQPPPLPDATPNPAIVAELSRAHRDGASSVESTPTRLFPSASHPSPSALKAGARAWREMHGRPASMGIDFRTGMSGHTALNSSSNHPHDFLEPRHSLTGWSNHSGLSMWKSGRPSGRVRAGSLNMPGPQSETAVLNSSGSS